MTIAPVVAPTRTVAPANEVRAANFIADNSAHYGAYRPGNYGSNPGANADALYFASLGRKRRRTQSCYQCGNDPEGAHGYLVL